MADADVDWQFWHEIDDGGYPGSYSLHAAAQPADRPRQGHLRPANQIGGGFHAPGRLHHRYASLDRIKQARQPGRKKVWQKAERLTPFGAVPPSDAQPLRRYARIAAVAGKGAAARCVQRAC